MRALVACFVLVLVLVFVMSTALVLAETAIYSGQPVSEAGLVLDPWGSGSAQENGEKTYIGTKSIKVTTGGWFEGGSIEFKTAAPLFKDKPGAGDYFVLVVSPTMQTAMSTDTSDRSWYVRAATPAKNYDLGAETVQTPKIQRMRLVLADDKGRRSEFHTTLVQSTESESGWLYAAIPLSKFKTSTGDTGYSLKKMLVFSDAADTIYIGAIRISQDTQTLSAETSDDLSYATGDSIPFQADVTPGLSSAKCSWDFDEKDGMQEDAVGEYVKRVYTSAGDYSVTLTVSDTNGVKSAFTKTIKVHIE